MLNYLPKPTIARVNGAAYGGGLGLIACCDIAVAAESCTLCPHRVPPGPGPGGYFTLPVPAHWRSACRRYFLTGERFDAGQARHIGLVHEQVPAGELDERGARLSSALLKGGPGGGASTARNWSSTPPATPPTGNWNWTSTPPG